MAKKWKHTIPWIYAQTRTLKFNKKTQTREKVFCWSSYSKPWSSRPAITSVSLWSQPYRAIMGDNQEWCCKQKFHFQTCWYEKLTEQAIQDITLESIKSTFKHILKIESNYWENDGLNVLPTISHFKINIQDTPSDSDSTLCWSSDEN